MALPLALVKTYRMQPLRAQSYRAWQNIGFAKRLAACAVGLLALLALAQQSALAQTALAQTPAWPAKPVRFINSFPPGGPSDILARAVAEVLQSASGQAVVVENKPGAAGNLGAAEVARAAADGTTVLWGIDTTFSVNPHIYPNMAFKLGSQAGELKPLVIISSSGLLLGTHAGRGFRSLQELVAAGKAKGLTFSSGGSGSPGHLGAEILTDAAGIKITHIPYRGNSPAVLAVVSGEVDGGILATPGMLPQVKAGKITALAVTSRQRSKLAPDIPTVAQAGFKELENEVLYLAMVPASTPEPLLAAMQKAVLDALAKPALQERIAALDMNYEGLTGAAALQRLNELSARYGKVIKATGMKVE